MVSRPIWRAFEEDDNDNDKRHCQQTPATSYSHQPSECRCVMCLRNKLLSFQLYRPLATEIPPVFNVGDFAATTLNRIIPDDELLLGKLNNEKQFLTTEKNDDLDPADAVMRMRRYQRRRTKRTQIEAEESRRKGGQIRFTFEQIMRLESRFHTKKYLTPNERRALADCIDLTERQVKTWFQNRRAKWRRVNPNPEETEILPSMQQEDNMSTPNDCQPQPSSQAFNAARHYVNPNPVTCISHHNPSQTVSWKNREI